MSADFPYLAIARERGADYARVLRYAELCDELERLRGDHWTRDAVEHLDPGTMSLIEAAVRAERERRARSC